MKMPPLVPLGLLLLLAAPAAAAKKAADAPQTLKDVLAAAKAEGKLAFVQYGREACGNCQALRGYIAQGQVSLPKNRFVYADLNCDDPATSQAFSRAFRVEGNMLPFVVIAGSDGKQLASRTGFGTPDQYAKFIHDAEKLAPRDEKPVARTPPRKAAVPAVVPHDDTREVRTWTAALSGQQIKAALVEEYAGAVVLRKEDGSKVAIEPARLTRTDQDYIEQIRRAAAEKAAAPAPTAPAAP